MDDTDGDFPLPGIESSHDYQEDEDNEDDSLSDIDPYYSDNSNDEKSDTSIIYTRELQNSVITELPNIIPAHPDGTLILLEGNNMRHCVELEQYYKGYMRRETIEPYQLHHLVVRLLWIPVIEGMSTTDDYRRLDKLIENIKSSADELLETNPLDNCEKALHVYLDLNISIITMRENLSDPGSIVEYINTISMQIARCFMFMEQYQHVCQICKKMDAHLSIKPGCSVFPQFFLIWIEALIKLGNIDIAKKKVKHYLALTTTKEDKDAVTSLVERINTIEEGRKHIEEEVVDSDNEYVKGSNYTGIKQERLKAKEVKENYQRRKRHRPKREQKTVEYFTMSTSWKGTKAKRFRSAMDTGCSNECISSSKLVETIQIPKGHEISDVESDEEFDKLTKDNWIGSDNTSTDDKKDSENESIDYYEQSVKLYERDQANKLNEYELLKMVLYYQKNI